MQETRVLVETKGTTGEETISYWFDLPIDVARQKLMNDPTFKHLSEDCQAYYFDFETYASHLLENRRYLVTEHSVFELPE